MKAEELQRAADRNDMKGLYSGLKEGWGLQTKQPVYLKLFDGLETFTYRKGVMARWSEYFRILLLPLVARCLETIDVCIWRMLVFCLCLVTVWGSVGKFVV